MKKLIPQSFIQKILIHTNIVDIINSKLNIKKQGKNFFACCPFHNDKTPSFSINEDKQFFYCFGCNIHGNVIDFLIYYDKLNFVEAVNFLSIFNNFKISYSNKKIDDNFVKIQNIYNLLKKINYFYQQNLIKHTSKYARNYLKSRGITKETIQKFSIGYANNNCNELINKFGNSLIFLEYLKNTGMIFFYKKCKYYDLFRNRIMFPIRNSIGKIIAFGGRVLNNNKPKYINSSETCIFHKKNVLYGLYEAKKENLKIDKLLLVEGYMDVISLHQFGITYAISTLGTSITDLHFKLLFKTTDEIICCYDSDKSGKKAIWRLLINSLKHITDGKKLRFLSLPNNTDPDMLIHKIGKNEFEKYIINSKPLSEFLFDILKSKIDLSILENKVKLYTLAVTLIKKISGNVLRYYMMKKLYLLLNIDSNNYIIKNLKKNEINNIYNIYIPKYKTIDILLNLIIKNPKLSTLVPDIDEFTQSDLNKDIFLFFNIVKLCKSCGNITTNYLLKIYKKNNIYYYIKNTFTYTYNMSENIMKQEFLDCLNHLYKLILKNNQIKLINREKLYGLTQKEKKEIWLINKSLSKF
ncbi:MAG: DNA primase [Enterobacterales bacterium]